MALRARTDRRTLQPATDSRHVPPVRVTLSLQAWVAGAIVVLDQASKAWIRTRLPELYDSEPVIDGFFSLTRVHNTGAAFGFMNNVDFPYKTAVVTLVRTAALGALAYYTSTLATAQWLSRLGLAFIIGGAIGNVIDGLTAGYVLDFVDVNFGDWHFWAFNVADASINVGVALMILELLGVGRDRVSRTV
jgi:signal peptidase II